MRRSVREALVGFSILGAIAGGFGLWFWLKGINLGRQTWTLTVRFEDAAGLASRSPVVFRGVQVGTVRRVTPTATAVVTVLDITAPDLRLAQPATARVQNGSLLGGDAQVALISGGRPLPASAPYPGDRRCDKAVMVCNGGVLIGSEAASLSTVTELMEKLLAQADREKLMSELAATTRSFNATSKEASTFLKDAQTASIEVNALVRKLNGTVGKADPVLANLNVATAEAVVATRHVRSLTAALDNPRTLNDLKATISNARQLTAKVDAVGGDVKKLTGDPAFMDGVRSVAIGLGQLFDELYPAQTAVGKERAKRGSSSEKGASSPQETDSGRDPKPADR